jgi:branched-chain amino acid transport system permease protein
MENTLVKKKNVKQLIPYAVLLLGFLAVPGVTANNYILTVAIIMMYRMIGSVGLRTIFLSGNISFSHGAFISLGAYCAGIMAKDLGLPPYITILAGGLFAALIGVLTGFPFVRLRGLYYCMASMFLCVAVTYTIQALPIAGGYRGLINIPPLTSNLKASYYIFVALTVVSLLAMYRFEFSRIGVTLRAIAQSPDVASSIGINETFYKLLAIGCGSFFAGLAGAAFALYSTVLSATNFGMTFSLWLLMYMMIGGDGKFIGPIIGTILFVLLPEIGRSFSSYAPYITAAAMLVVAYLLPGGLAGIPDFIRSKRRKNKPDSQPPAEGGQINESA